MTDSYFITIRAAAELAGVSKKTIERAYKKHLKQNGLTIETARDVLRVQQQGSRRHFLILERFVRESVMKSAAASRNRINTGIDAELVRQLTVKDEQLRAKDEQIRTRDHHIASLTERLRDAQHSLQAEQAMLAQVQTRPWWRFLLSRERFDHAAPVQHKQPKVRWYRVATATSFATVIGLLGAVRWLAVM